MFNASSYQLGWKHKTVLKRSNRFLAIVADKQAETHTSWCFITLYAWSITFIDFLRDTAELRSYYWGMNVFQTRVWNDHQVRITFRIAQRYCKAEAPLAILLARDHSWLLFCWVPCWEFVLIIYDHIALVMSVVHITDVYWLYQPGKIIGS